MLELLFAPRALEPRLQYPHQRSSSLCCREEIMVSPQPSSQKILPCVEPGNGLVKALTIFSQSCPLGRQNQESHSKKISGHQRPKPAEDCGFQNSTRRVKISQGSSPLETPLPLYIAGTHLKKQSQKLFHVTGERHARQYQLKLEASFILDNLAELFLRKNKSVQDSLESLKIWLNSSPSKTLFQLWQTPNDNCFFYIFFQCW